ncbi:helix-turn-helix domain-containing protein, partial [Nonomuraea dietziae]|uniref:helix-turn-helix domain-containing protein n=1 Tax=Nonomuraea dietziae TaxID=65515 RepID=UPI003438F384
MTWIGAAAFAARHGARLPLLDEMVALMAGDVAPDVAANTDYAVGDTVPVVQDGVAGARQERGESITAIAKHLGVGRSTLYRALDEEDRPAAATTTAAPMAEAAVTKQAAPMPSKAEDEACDAATYAMATALQERRPDAYRAIMNDLTPAERDQV